MTLKRSIQGTTAKPFGRISEIEKSVLSIKNMYVKFRRLDYKCNKTSKVEFKHITKEVAHKGRALINAK